MVPMAGDTATLRVYLVGARDDEEAELLIFFRDGSSGRGSYPAGRFVAAATALRGTLPPGLQPGPQSLLRL